MPRARLKVGVIRLAIIASCLALAGCVATGQSTGDLGAAPEVVAQAPGHIAVSTHHASAAELRRSRGENLEELRLSYDVFNSESKRTHQVTLGIGADYIHVTQGAVRTIYDFEHRRVIDVDLENGRFFNYSLYAEAIAIFRELHSRTALSEILDTTLPGVPIAADVQQAFWRESVLGKAPSPPSRLEITSTETDGIVAFQEYHRNIVQFFPAREIGPSASEIKLFYKFMRLALTAHPSIVDDLEARGGLPQILVLRKPDSNESAWTLTKFERVQSRYPLRDDAILSIEAVRGWTSDRWHGAERHLAVRHIDGGLYVEPLKAPTLERILPVMLAAVAGTQGSGPPRREDWLRRMEVARQDGALLEAGLLWLEHNLQWCQVSRRCFAPKHVLDAALTDDRFKIAFVATETENVEQVLYVWANISSEDAPTAYLVDLFLANQIVTTRLAEPKDAVMEDFTIRANTAKAFGLFESAILGNPYNPSAYKDLGDFYQSRADFRRAWIAYDLGRSLAGAHFVGTFVGVNDYEMAISDNLPEFF